MDQFAEALEMAIGGTRRTELAGAKINLALHVGARRSDGYHLLESMVVFADFGDALTAAPASNSHAEVTVKGPFARDLVATTEPGENLAIRAAEALAMEAGFSSARQTRLVLNKRLPVAAGLGGGSADAAATLRLLDRQWGLGFGTPGLVRIGQRLGADVPMCLTSQPLFAEGIGERIRPIFGIPRLPIVLASPPVQLSTSDVFAALDEETRSPLPPLPGKFSYPLDLVFWLRQTRNDLSDAASRVSKRARAAAKVLARDRDCLFARMSGSGPAAFGIFASNAASERAAARIRDAKPSWWVVSAVAGGS